MSPRRATSKAEACEGSSGGSAELIVNLRLARVALQGHRFRRVAHQVTNHAAPYEVNFGHASHVELTDSPFNEPVIRYLRSQATPGHDDSWNSWDLEGWQLHAHPDLSDRFAEVSPTGVNLIPAYGLDVLVASGVAAGFVLGTHCLFLRLPAPPTDVAQNPYCATTFAAPDWYAIDPWQSDVSTAVGLHMLRTLTETAYQFALTLT
jgi:hypothetical protein